MFIKEKDADNRKEILEFLETKGFRLDEDEFRDKQEIIDSVLPVSVNTEEMTYKMMGSITSAAAASSKGVLMTREEFYEQIILLDKKES